ncbi:ssDNA-binding domain-containing protein [Antribacter sp. KLBMP9083]|uniref:SsDNA-binding domain-containing protein n=1 Tax=Antribacter soli TaxID=2910976 RepID=A0AA41QF76_9MICO|nr:ArdC-like ssDNA-binding domain-containing protein [Antribacter soli]MCF4122047.1 ssDNA-binding domain-containing protein [Antribacter soli]
MSAPEPTYVAGFQQWKNLGRSVRKGVAGYQILAPRTARMASRSPGDPTSWRRLDRGEKPGPGETVHQDDRLSEAA